MHQVIAVKECQGVEGRTQPFAHLVGRTSPLRKNLSQGLLCVLHDNEQKGVAAELASSEIQQAHQVWMSEAGSRPPIRELRLALYRVGGNELDRGIYRAARLGQEYYAVVGFTQKWKQREDPVDDLAFPPGPILSRRHSSCPPRSRRTRRSRITIRDIGNSPTDVCGIRQQRTNAAYFA